MTVEKKKYLVTSLIIASILIIDQIVKIWIKTHLQIGEDIPLIGEWCRIHFVENEGMAFGMAFGGSVGKLCLTLFRLCASGAILWYMIHAIKKGVNWLHIISIALIFVGAVGNLIDSCFYGLIFNESYYSIATLFPPEGGYAPLFHGRVVDMFYFPLIDTNFPEWMPLVGGNRFEFFNAIFNVADSAITIGVILLIIDQLIMFKKEVKAIKSVEEKASDSVKNESAE